MLVWKAGSLKICSKEFIKDFPEENWTCRRGFLAPSVKIMHEPRRKSLCNAVFRVGYDYDDYSSSRPEELPRGQQPGDQRGSHGPPQVQVEAESQVLGPGVPIPSVADEDIHLILWRFAEKFFDACMAIVQHHKVTTTPTYIIQSNHTSKTIRKTTPKACTVYDDCSVCETYSAFRARVLGIMGLGVMCFFLPRVLFPSERQSGCSERRHQLCIATQRLGHRRGA